MELTTAFLLTQQHRIWNKEIFGDASYGKIGFDLLFSDYSTRKNADTFEVNPKVWTKI